MHIDPTNPTVSQALSRGDYLDGYPDASEADWLHDCAIQCECCGEWFDTPADLTDEGVCDECQPYVIEARLDGRAVSGECDLPRVL